MNVSNIYYSSFNQPLTKAKPKDSVPSSCLLQPLYKDVILRIFSLIEPWQLAQYRRVSKEWKAYIDYYALKELHIRRIIIQKGQSQIAEKREQFAYSFSLGANGFVCFGYKDNPIHGHKWAGSFLTPNSDPTFLEKGNIWELCLICGPADKGTLVGSNKYSRICVWDKTGKLTHSLELTAKLHKLYLPIALSFDEASSCVAIGTLGGTIALWDYSKDRFFWLKAIAPTWISFDPKSRCVFWRSGLDLRMTDFQNSSSKTLSLDISSVVYHAKNKGWIIASYQHTKSSDILIWDSTTLKNVSKYCLNNEVVIAFHYEESSALLFASTSPHIESSISSSIHVWETTYSREIACIKPQNQGLISQIAFDPKASMVMTSDIMGSLAFWSFPAGNLLKVIEQTSKEDVIIENQIRADPEKGKLTQVVRQSNQILCLRTITYSIDSSVEEILSKEK